MQDIKENLYKWRAKKERKDNNEKKTPNRNKEREMEKQVDMLDELIEKVKIESKRREKIREDRKIGKEKMRSKREEVLEEKRSKEEERKERIRLQKKLEEKWEIIKHIISEKNQEH